MARDDRGARPFDGSLLATPATLTPAVLLIALSLADLSPWWFGTSFSSYGLAGLIALHVITVCSLLWQAVWRARKLRGSPFLRRRVLLILLVQCAVVCVYVVGVGLCFTEGLSHTGRARLYNGASLLPGLGGVASLIILLLCGRPKRSQ